MVLSDLKIQTPFDDESQGLKFLHFIVVSRSKH